MPQKSTLIEIISEKVKTKKKLYKSYDYSNPLQKYSLEEYLEKILYVLKTGIAWRDLECRMNWNSVFKAFRKLVKYGIIKECYNDIINEYLDKSSISKTKILITDTSFIPNKNGKDLIGRNKYYSKKNGTKISAISNDKGIPLYVNCYKGNRNDAKILESDIDKMTNSGPIKDIIKEKRNKYFLADAGYDTNNIKSKLTKLNFKHIIAKNKRNNKKPIKKTNNKKIFKKRVIIEHLFKRIKNYRRISNRYDCKINSFNGFLYLALLSIFLSI